MSTPRTARITLADGRLLVVTTQGEQVSIEVDGITVLVLDRPDAWGLAETLDAVASGA